MIRLRRVPLKVAAAPVESLVDERESAPDIESVRVGLTILQAQIQEQINAGERIEQKAIAAITIVFGLGFLSGQRLTGSLWAVIAVGAALLALACAAIVLRSTGLYVGADAPQLAKATNLDVLRFSQAAMNALADSIKTNDAVLLSKGKVLNLELVLAVVAVCAIGGLAIGSR